MSYLDFGTKEFDEVDMKNLSGLYEEGYVVTRKNLSKVRSIRIKLSEFDLTSENRRILRKYSHQVIFSSIPYENYSWHIHKMGKDFYDAKFGEGVFTANKIKELFTVQNQFNTILSYIESVDQQPADGYCIGYMDAKILHYAYPFYQTDLINSSFGMYMMTSMLAACKEKGLEYVYLGSAHESASLYKLQFKGLEWWDETTATWNTDINVLKDRVISQS